MQLQIRKLIDLGLNANEANLYYAALSCGPSSVLQLAKASRIKRTTVYSIVESLLISGLMRIETKGFKKLYVAEAPEKLASILESKRSSLDSLIPELNALHNLAGAESFIKYYKGLTAVKSVYEGLIRDVKPKEDYLIISDQSKWYNLDPVFFEDFTKRRAKLDINIKLLLTDTEMARDFQRRQKSYNMTIKFLPKNTILTTNMVVIPKRVVIHQTVPPTFATVIENQSIVQMHRELFKIIWDSQDNTKLK